MKENITAPKVVNFAIKIIGLYKILVEKKGVCDVKTIAA